MPRSAMIKAVFFDFYKTLVYFWPPLDEIQQASCAELGLSVGKEGIPKGYKLAFTEYERRILSGAGLDVSPRLAWEVWKMAIQVPKDFNLFDDVVPSLKRLKSRGVVLGIISNLRRDMTALCTRLGLDPYVDFCVTSLDAGAEKPHPPIFKAALERAHVAPGEAMHVGDQYQSDVQGARAVGIHPVLLDREGWYENVSDCSRIAALPELDGLVTAGGR